MANPLAIPAPTSIDDPQLVRILNAIRDQIETEQAARAQIQQTLQRSGLQGDGQLGGGQGGVTGPIAVPDAITGLSAVGMLGAILLTVDTMPPAASYLEWLAAPVDDLSQAHVIGTSRAPIFTYYVGDHVGRYFWVRAVGRHGVEGPINATHGEYAITSLDPDYVKQVLTEQITHSELADTLNDELDHFGVAIDKLGNAYVVRIDQSGYVAGYGLALDPDNHVSRFIVNADQFGITTPTRTWAPHLNVTDDTLVSPTYGSDQWVYEAQGGGTTGHSEPAWPSTVGATVADGSVTWEAVRRKTTTPLLISKVDGEYQAVLTADVTIMGDLSISQISSGKLDREVSITIGGDDPDTPREEQNGSIFLAGDGTMILYGDGPKETANRMVLTDGDLVSYRYVGGELKRYESLKRVQQDTANNGDTVELDGIWLGGPPSIQTALQDITIFDPTIADAKQTLRVNAENIRRAGYTWRFDVVAERVLDGEESIAINDRYSDNQAVASWQSDEYTTPAGATMIELAIKHYAVAHYRGTPGTRYVPGLPSSDGVVGMQLRIRYGKGALNQTTPWQQVYSYQTGPFDVSPATDRIMVSGLTPGQYSYRVEAISDNEPSNNAGVDGWRKWFEIQTARFSTHGVSHPAGAVSWLAVGY